jgi:hypothetical protein
MKIISTICLSLFLLGCSKDFFSWELEKRELKKGTLVFTNDCSTLIGVNSLYNGMNGTSDNWGISANGYNGSCWTAPDPQNFGNLSLPQGSCYVEFENDFNHKGYLEFMFLASINGNSGREPNIFIDGNIQSKVTFLPDENGSYYSKTVSDTISTGNHSIRIEFQGSGEHIKVDEIQIFEYIDSL